MDPTLDESLLRRWVGKTESTTDVLTADHARRMELTLDRSASLADRNPLPPLWHWLFFVESAPHGGLGADGHPARGGFLPPVALPRRMWAGGTLDFEGHLLIGETATKTSIVDDVNLKSGSSGALCFVKVRHVVEGAAGTITEVQDIVYREEPKPDAAPAPSKPAPTDAQWCRTITPDPVMLFRYSALTFNGHRIHYDRPYAVDTEGYGGLVFQGPFTATLLADLAAANMNGRLESFTFRGVAPLLDTAPFQVCGRAEDGNVDLWAQNTEGGLVMSATASFGG